MEKKKFTAITVIFSIISAAFLLIIAAMLVPYLRSVLGLEVYIEKLLGKGTYYIVAGVVGFLLLLSLGMTVGAIVGSRKAKKEGFTDSDGCTDTAGAEAGDADDADVYRRNALEELRKASSMMTEIEALSKSGGNNASGNGQNRE